MRSLIAATVAGLLATPCFSADFVPVAERSAFIELINNRELRLSTWDITLTVSPGGQISGNMLGWDLTGSWTWQDGFFCREIDWSGYEIDYNCQLVEAKGTQSLRFTVDRGAGKSAVFALQ